jgi:hypothetical protein
MEDKKELSQKYLSLKSKVAILVDQINASDANEGQKDEIMQTLSGLAFLSGGIIGSLDRYQDITKNLISLINLNIETTEECLENFALAKEMKQTLESVISFLNGVVNELEKIGYE